MGPLDVNIVWAPDDGNGDRDIHARGKIPLTYIPEKKLIYTPGKKEVAYVRRRPLL